MDGFHKLTGTKFDNHGFDKNSIHKVTKTKFDEDGIHKLTGTKFDEDGFDKYGFDGDDGIHKVTGTKLTEDGFDIRGFNEMGFDRNGVHRNGTRFNEGGISVNGTRFNKAGFNKAGFSKAGFDKYGFDNGGIHKETFTNLDEDGFNKDGFDEYDIHRITGTKFDEAGFDKDCIHKVTGTIFNEYGIHKVTGTKFDEFGFNNMGFNRDGFDRAGYDEKGFNKDGFDADGYLQFELTSIFSKTATSFDSDFSAVIGLAYNEPTKMKSKLFFSHDKKMGIYSKEFESFSNKNVVHIRIEKARKQSNANWIKPKDTGNKQGDNFEPGYTLIVNFNKNDTALKKFVIDKLGELEFGSLTSGYTLHCHKDEDYPTDERAKELLQTVTGLFSSENTNNKKNFIFPDILNDVYFQPDDVES